LFPAGYFFLAGFFAAGFFAAGFFAAMGNHLHPL